MPVPTYCQHKHLKISTWPVCLLEFPGPSFLYWAFRVLQVESKLAEGMERGWGFSFCPVVGLSTCSHHILFASHGDDFHHSNDLRQMDRHGSALNCEDSAVCPLQQRQRPGRAVLPTNSGSRISDQNLWGCCCSALQSSL